MNIIRRRTRIAALLAITTISAAGVVAGAGSASAYGVVQTDDVSINRVGFDIGGSGWNGADPTGPAELEWSTAWFANIPTVSGYLHFKGVANNCARVRVISFDENDIQVGETAFSDEECVSGNGHIRRAFEVQGALAAASVEVTLQTALNVAGASWGGIGSQTFEYGPTVGTDLVKISRAEVDFGVGTFANGTAPSSGTLHWEVINGYQIRPRLEGTLYMKEAKYLCARVNLKYSSSLPNIGVIDTTYGEEHCASDDDLHTFAVNHFNPAVASSMIDTVKVILEVRPDGGAWSTRGSATVRLP